jgi:hypothetical protein
MVIFCKSLRYDFSLAGPEGKNKVNNHHWIQRPVLKNNSVLDLGKSYLHKLARLHKLLKNQTLNDPA